MTSYLVNNSGTKLIAVLPVTTASGTAVRYSWAKVEEHIDAARNFNLVNAHHGKVSNAKKWGSDSVQHAHMNANHGCVIRATEINPHEFLVS